MEKVNINKLKKLPHGKGSKGICYILNNNYLIKDSYFGEDAFYITYPECNIKYLIDIKNDTYIFPVDYYSEGGRVFQTKLPYIKNALDLEMLNYNINLSNLVLCIDKLYKNTKDISEFGLLTHDIWSGNILYKENKLYLIDREEDIRIKASYKQVISENLFNINRAIYIYLLGKYEKNSLIKDIMYDDNYLYEMIENIYSKDSDVFLLKEFLIRYKHVMNDYIEEQEDNLGRILKRVGGL